MSELVVIAYPDEHRAAKVYEALHRTHHDLLFDVDTPTALYVTKDREGEVQIHPRQRLGHVGVLGGGAAGLLLGLVFTVPVVGAVVGAGAAALVGRGAELGISDEFVDQLSTSLAPGSSALFLLLRPVSIDDTLAVVGKYGGTLQRASLPPDVEERLERSLAFWNEQNSDRGADPGPQEAAARDSAPSAGA
jgi:uncharacterized membrane protein